jgi:DNA-3-methyladenine glycosylase
MVGELLASEVLAVDAVTAARRLLGRHLVHGPVVLRIVETEAYFWPGDTACHARAGRTARNAPIWGPPGHAYVYLCYGIHRMLNVSAGRDGEAAGVLIRGAEVVEGHDVVRARRGRLGRGALAGPGKVTAALGIDLGFAHHPLLRPGGLELRDGPPPAEVVAGPRIGIDYALPEHRDAPWRFADGASDQVAKLAALRKVDARPGPGTAPGPRG